MKKVATTSLLACFIFLIVSIPAFAATSATVHLPSSFSTVYSNNIDVTASQNIKIFAENYWYSDEHITWTLYKVGHGSLISGVVTIGSTDQLNLTNNWGAGEYYLRLDCYFPAEYHIGCEGMGQVSAN